MINQKYFSVISFFLLRFGINFLIFLINPIFAILINMVFDCIDWMVFKYIFNLNEFCNGSQYEYYDKAADYIWYIFLVIFLTKSSIALSPLLMVLFLYRSIGQLFFLLTKGKERYFIYFPNFFEWFALTIIIVGEFDYFFYQKFWGVTLLIFVGLLKVYHEIITHKYVKSGINVFDVMKFVRDKIIY